MKLHKSTRSIVLTSGVLLAACASNYESANHVAWSNSDDTPYQALSASEIPANQVNLVFLRDADGLSPQTAVNIGVNGRYQASLHGGNYTSVFACAGDLQLSTQITANKNNDLGYQTKAFDAKQGQTYYFKVTVDEAGASSLTPLITDAALTGLAGKPKQAHTISRVVEKSCQTTPKQVTASPASQPVANPVAQAHFLFGFNEEILTMQEIAKVDDLANKIVASHRNYDVFVAGHADPVGSNQYNQALAHKRAIHVAEILKWDGIHPKHIKVQSFGEAQPVKSCAGISDFGSVKACNLENRRVTVMVKLG